MSPVKPAGSTLGKVTLRIANASAHLTQSQQWDIDLYNVLLFDERGRGKTLKIAKLA